MTLALVLSATEAARRGARALRGQVRRPRQESERTQAPSLTAFSGVGEGPLDGSDEDLLRRWAYGNLTAKRADGPVATDPAAERRRSDLAQAQLEAYARDVRTSYRRELERARELEETYLATVHTLAAAVEAKDDYTGGHLHRVLELGLLLARELAPADADDPQLAYGFLLHDIGKLAIPDAILAKPGQLTPVEWDLVRRHPEAGARILANVRFLGRASDVVLHHHERWDGGGYPSGLAGEDIPPWARIFAVVDAIDAMTSDRPYRAARPLAAALDQLRALAGRQFDPRCVEAFTGLDAEEVERLLEQRGPRDLAVDALLTR